MNHNPPLQGSDLWTRLVRAHLHGTDEEFVGLLELFLGEDVDRVTLLHQALHSSDKNTALFVLPNLSVVELKALFEDLVWLASFSHGGMQTVRSVILSLPREWVMEHVEPVAEPILGSGTDDEYRRLLELYTALDRALALKLTRHALAHENPDIREAGQDFAQRLGVE